MSGWYGPTSSASSSAPIVGLCAHVEAAMPFRLYSKRRSAAHPTEGRWFPIPTHRMRTSPNVTGQSHSVSEPGDPS
jgi:hypothetical protein